VTTLQVARRRSRRRSLLDGRESELHTHRINPVYDRVGSWYYTRASPTLVNSAPTLVKSPPDSRECLWCLEELSTASFELSATRFNCICRSVCNGCMNHVCCGCHRAKIRLCPCCYVHRLGCTGESHTTSCSERIEFMNQSE
jgi:hypothetical protein